MRGKSLRNLAMALAMDICLAVLPVACAAGEEVAPAVDAPATGPVPASEPAPAPAEEAAPAPTEESATATPAEEATEVGETAPAEEAPAEQEAIGNDDPASATDEEIPFTGSVSVELVNEGEVYYGDRVTLRANISDVSAAYRIRWEVNCQDGMGWRVIPDEQGSEYEFVVNPQNVNYEYRVVLVSVT